MFDRYWRVRQTLPGRYGMLCRILARGRLNSCLVEFEDGYKTVTSRWSVRLTAEGREKRREKRG